MVKPLRHRQTKDAARDMFDLKPLRHTSTLPFASRFAVSEACPCHVCLSPETRRESGRFRSAIQCQLADVRVTARAVAAAYERRILYDPAGGRHPAALLLSRAYSRQVH